jgi:hypothetical protein
MMVTTLFGGLVGCNNDSESGIQAPAAYKDFNNYPTGLTSPNGMLTINNNANRETLLFYGTAAPSKYIGTADSLRPIKVNLPEEGPYSIIAIDKASYEERGFEATQYSLFTYYSTSQAFSISVSPTSNWGIGTLRINNFSNCWVVLKSLNGTQTYGAVQPKQQMVNIPVSVGTYHIIPYFYREIRANNTIVGVIDMPVTEQSRDFEVTDTDRLHIHDFTDANVSTNITPLVKVINQSNQGVSIFRSNDQMLNGSLHDDFVLNSGKETFIIGFAQGNNVQTINFRASAWGQNHRFVPQSMEMKYGKAYIITIPLNGEASDITVVEEDSKPYLD